MSKKRDISKKIIEEAKSLGYIDCGITDISPFEKFEEKVIKRIKNYPESESFYKGLLNRIDPLDRFSEAEALVVCIWRYGQYEIPGKVDKYIGKNYLFDGRNKYSENYQARRQLEKYMDNLGLEYRKGGVPDRWAAVRAGVGNFGRNNFIYTEYGSWINVETWLIDKKTDTVHENNNLPCPPDCRKCIDSCPTGALEAPFKMNPYKCIPFLTYDHPDLTPVKYREDMGTWLYGCDVCQNECPLNENKLGENKEYPRLGKIASRINPASIFGMDQSFFENEINSRFFYIDDIVYWKMNALRAAANIGDEKYIDLMEKALKSDKNRIKKMAEWGIEKIQK